ncbi:MAG: hypothetical protein ACR2OE_04095 [Thermomicrobiales bacterium]
MATKTIKPIRVFYNALFGTFWATQHYREEVSEDGKRVTTIITGTKYDVTQDIARAVVEEDIVFSRKTSEESK